MQYLATVNIIQCQTQLNKPVHNFSLSKLPFFCLLFSNMVSEVSVLTEFHYDNEYTLLNERMLV